MKRVEGTTTLLILNQEIMRESSYVRLVSGF
jgi:hypothetical protein